MARCGIMPFLGEVLKYADKRHREFVIPMHIAVTSLGDF